MAASHLKSKCQDYNLQKFNHYKADYKSVFQNLPKDHKDHYLKNLPKDLTMKTT